jgi:hypothetical protein
VAHESLTGTRCVPGEETDSMDLLILAVDIPFQVAIYRPFGDRGHAVGVCVPI